MVTSKSNNRSFQGFSLVEVLAVISIIILLAAIGTFQMQPPRPVHAARLCAGTIEAARSEAIRAGTRSRIAICVDANAEELYLTQLIVLIDNDGDLSTNDWRVTSTKQLPQGTVFWTDYSGPLTGSEHTMSIALNNPSFQSGSDNIEYQYIEFDGLGQCEGSTQWVFCRGETTDFTVSIINEADRDGFIIRKTGRLTYFEDPEQISPPS